MQGKSAEKGHELQKGQENAAMARAQNARKMQELQKTTSTKSRLRNGHLNTV